MARPGTKPRFLEAHSDALKVTLFKRNKKVKQERRVKYVAV